MTSMAPPSKAKNHAANPGLRGSRKPPAPKSADALRLGRLVLGMRLDRGWNQTELAARIERAEGRPAVTRNGSPRDPDQNRVSRVENGFPVTLRNLKGFAQAFGFRSVLEWLLAATTLSESEQELVERFRSLEDQGQAAVLNTIRALPARRPSKTPAPNRNPRH